MKELDYVELIKEQVNMGLPVGMRGTIVFLYNDGQTCEVEFEVAYLGNFTARIPKEDLKCVVAQTDA